ncbi:MAG TPA: hypothetical protein VF384_02615 [Planctomycetota bacterium]
MAACTLLAACAAVAYSPLPVDLGGQLPPDAYGRCKEVLEGLGALEVDDEKAFLLRTAWYPVDDPLGERRAAVFRDDDPFAGPDLAVVVEFRRPSLPLFGLPEWSSPRGDAAAERELVESLRQALTASRF